MSQFDFDIGIIGGGPGGSALAAYLAKAGLSCVVFEQDHFPRHRVGEALVPASNRVFQDLGLIEKMNKGSYRKKYGGAWAGPWFNPVYVRFTEPNGERSTTFHVNRSEFDLMLLQHASELGATIYEGIRVQQVDFSQPGQPSINYVIGEQNVSTRVRMVVDASGRKTLLGNQLKLRIRDEVFDQYAIHTWFEGYDRISLVNDRSTYEDEFTFIYFLPILNTWLWQIPISDTITSVGVVTQKKNFAKSRQEREAFFWSCIESSPQLAASLRSAQQIRPLFEEGDYSYAMKQICGDNFMLIGDAARFVDPIFSTGVSIALNSARYASADIIRAAESGDFSRKSFQTYEETIRRGTKNWYDLISVFYRLNMIFATFAQDEQRLPALSKILQGDVYDEDDPEVLQIMKQTVKDVEQNENHPWHPFLGELTSQAFSPRF